MFVQPNSRRHLPHLQIFERPLFVTFATRRRLELPQSARTLVLQHALRDHGTRLHMHVAVVMPDHVHVVFAPFPEVPLSKIMQGIKGSSARAVNRLLSRQGPLWQEESWDRVVRLREGLQQTMLYVAENPMRSGLVSPGQEYPWLWRDWVEGAPAAD